MKFYLLLGASVEDLLHLLSTLRYWGYPDIPEGLLFFCFENAKEVRKIIKLDMSELAYLKALMGC